MGDLENNGYVVSKVEGLSSQLTSLKEEIFFVFNAVSTGCGFHSISTDEDIVQLHKINQPLQFQILKLLWGAPKLMALANNEYVLKKLVDLGLRTPVLELQPLLRCDMPVAGQSIFGQHQDYTYNIGSSNSVTVWIPLQNTDVETGALLVASGSHVKGVYPNKKGIITSEYSFDFKPCPVEFGEVLIFDQKLVHQSGFNRSGGIRFSVQLRYSDLSDPEYLQRGCPINHKVTTESFAGEIS